MKKICFIFVIVSCLFTACKKSRLSPVELFSIQEDLPELKCHFNEDMLARIEAIQCNDSSLIVFDYHSGYSFTLFDLKSENVMGRFGEIGQGPGEIPLGCYGYLYNKNFIISYDHPCFIATYPIDSLRANIRFKPLILVKYEIPEALFSHVTPVNDTLFFGAGSYRSEYQFVLFDRKNKVIDFNVEIYNAKDETFNISNKFLSNQGTLRKHPVEDKFVYAVNNSSNIDFVKISNNKIKLLKSIRLRDPDFTPEQDGIFYSVLPDAHSPIGYIDISTSRDYVFALYTDKPCINAFSSQLILVFDWNGNPIKMLHLNQEAYYIAVCEKQKRIYAAIKNEDKGWSITSYKIDN